MSEPVENIFWHNMHDLKDGKYVVIVNNYQKRTNESQGFKLQFATTEEIVTFYASTQ